MDFSRDVSVDYRKLLREGEHLLKVVIHSLGVYIDGWRIVRSDKSNSGWWLQPPSRKYMGRFIPVVELDKHHEFWNWLEARAIELAEEFEKNPKPTTSQDNSSRQYTQESISKDLDAAFIELEMKDRKVNRPDPWKNT